MNTEEIKKIALEWTKSPFDNETQKEVQDLLNSNETDWVEAFYKDLVFGTGGMRGVVGAGTNKINRYTLGKATQGLSNYIHRVVEGEKSVAIGYDCRHDSEWLAKVVADVLTANGIKVYLFDALRPTPELSFAVRHFNCTAGIVLTASHNPPEYNGYKVYWTDGGQIVPPQDGEIISEVNKVEFSAINFQGDQRLIQIIGKEVDKAFIDGAVKNATAEIKGREDLKIVFTSIHGTSIKLIPDTLSQAGYTQVHIVKEQSEPDGDFPTVVSPNPEEPEALSMAVSLAEKVDADIVLGTDPDSDRIGVATRNMKGEMVLLNGNQTMALMTNFLVKKWKNEGRLNGKQFVGSTIVSTNLVDRICESNDVEIKIGLTGFKWIAKMIRDHQELEFIGGGEESFGYMVGDFVRDKDAVSSGLLACEIAAEAKSRGSSMYEELLEIYKEHGFYKEHLIALVKKGLDGAKLIADMMVELRNNPLSTIDGSKVTRICDYENGTERNMLTGEVKQLDIPKSNVLIYHTEDGSKVAARPSGTEPKIKFYFSVNKSLDDISQADEVERALDAKIQRIIKEMNLN